MKAEIRRPDAMPPGVRAFTYWVFCWMNRHIRVWRAIGNVLRRWPSLGNGIQVAARRSSVKRVLARARSFSNTSHTANLIAGDFLIGMDPGLRYDADKLLFDSILASLNTQEDADAEAKRRVEQLTTSGSVREFDMVEDYLTWVVHRAISPAFGAATQSVVSASRDSPLDEALERGYLHEIRHVAAHLFAGRLAPVNVQRRAEASAASLASRVERMTPEIGMAWPASRAMPYSGIRRNGVGLAWVSHPVTVQSGALLVQELLTRPKVYKALREAAASLGQRVWMDLNFRKNVSNHVLELMRFRPVFPLLARDVAREAEFDSGARRNAKCPAGSQLTVLSIAAMFDTHDTPDAGQFCPHRSAGVPEPWQYLMFGYGDRQCPAKHHAVTMLTSALIGLLTLPELRLAGRWGARIRYDGPLICEMRMGCAKTN